ncbi:GNAT family N-acetyltransferase [[Clostridium] polysaccharolyticum]|uniref:Acetyltransferase (GNAT) family protein n=1 Tax=[Clostridium] polysaccharolyticum TaxID=29364 RepID=A0A1I0DA47_9FIRM|nr:GNAT family N-acetyltransferase [[Clostridium] polysaccharolyticum]SET28420.1 Acetyltransferase (GNAT) family protein [[Clostridium] polysaccharolyticum]
MNDYIKKIDELSFNAWPSHKTELYDGWILRYSSNYTHRTNCVNLIGQSSLPLSQKVAFCENEYKMEKTPCIFKISPLIDKEVDKYLESQGYCIEHITDNMTLSFQNFISFPNDIDVILENELTDEWINNLLHLNGTTDPNLKKIVPYMYHSIPKPTVSASIYQGGVMVASGLGILDREHIGIYAIYVHQDYRRRHYAHAICDALIHAGMQRGAVHAYLQVVKDNTPARTLYESLGFKYLYTYWFRTKYML